MADEDPTTQELRVAQIKREVEERERASAAPGPDDTDQHERRADKASYLRQKLDERAEAERRAREDSE